jgi:CDP-diacylglycerol--glycerol-3-phosphate 3-phosphatidyltransferase
MNVPNALTLARIFLVPLLVAALVQRDMTLAFGFVLLTNEQIALAVFLIAGATDLLDGYLARRLQQITTVGTLLDPIADKLLISAALISLVQVRIVPAWMAILIIGREFAVSGLRSIAASEGLIIKANQWGKLKTATQVVAISICMLSMRFPELYPIAMTALWVVVAATILSAFVYFQRFWRTLDQTVKQRKRRELLLLERQQRKLERSSRVRHAGAENRAAAE